MGRKRKPGRPKGNKNKTSSKKKKKWGKLGAPGSAKRKTWMAKIRGKR